jgi:hypothetical protein
MIAIFLIFVLGVAGWTVLGSAMFLRSGELGHRLQPGVVALWGGPIVQEAPSLTRTIPGTDRVQPILPSRNEIDVDLKVDHRRKGLVWYPTYVCDFTGTYTVTNEEEVALKVQLHFPFPVAGGTYDGFAFESGGESKDIQVDTEEGIRDILEVKPGATETFGVKYRTRGLREWRYRPDGQTGRLRNLTLRVRTDFHDYDFPEGAISPMVKKAEADGMALQWEATDLITSQDIGVVVPEKLNPGPIAARMSFFAPVSLIFFFALIATLNVVWRIAIHPMHYLFTTAGFFAFHLLFAYLVDHVDIHVSFVIAALTSLVLVTTYLTAALGSKFPWKVSAAGQVFYLILFSYTFFLKGFTGLVVTIGAVATLAVLMRVTARTDWTEFFGRARPVKAPQPVPEPTDAG